MPWFNVTEIECLFLINTFTAESSHLTLLGHNRFDKKPRKGIRK